MMTSSLPIASARMRERRRAKRQRTRPEYLSSCLTATKPWEAEGISRATWYRKRETTHGRNNSIKVASIPVSTVEVERPKGCREGSGEEKPRITVGMVGERDRNASCSSALRPSLVSTENSKLLAALNNLKDGVHGK